MQIPTNALEVYAIAGVLGNDPREEDQKLSCVRVEKTKAIASDGSACIVTDFDPDGLINGGALAKPQNIPRAIAALAIRQAKTEKAGLELVQEEDGPTFYSSQDDSKEGTVLRFHSPTSKYVPYGKVMRPKIEGGLSVSIDPKKLKDLLTIAIKQGAQSVHLTTGKTLDPMELRWEGLEMRSVARLMPMRDSTLAENKAKDDAANAEIGEE